MFTPTAHLSHRAANRARSRSGAVDVRPRAVTLLQRCQRMAAVIARRAAATAWHTTAARLRHRDVDATGSLPRQFRLALEELGPTFVKLGQLLSARSDIIPKSLQHELSTLRDHAPSIPHATVMAELQRGIGPSAATEVFASFGMAPVACASIGQVHRATLCDGRRVAVKVRRPGVRADIEADLALVSALSRLVARLSRRARAYDPVRLVDEFAAILRAETDYTTEASNMEALRRTFANDQIVTIPAVLTSLSNESLLTMDWIEGIPLNNSDELDEAGIDRADVARAIGHAYAAMIFQSDRFHADPHPGNLIALTGGRLGLIDFGEVGTVAPATRTALMRLLSAVLTRDTDNLAEAVLSISQATRALDRDEFGAQLATLLVPIADASLQDLKLGGVLRQLLHLLRNQGLMLPVDLAVLIKTLIVCEATTDELDPTLNIGIFLTGLITEDPTRTKQT
jgi:ubiquinone biosynthesis protein